MKTNYVWVIEMRFGKSWRPTVGMTLTRKDAEMALDAWQGKCPNDQFRVVKYMARK